MLYLTKSQTPSNKKTKTQTQTKNKQKKIKTSNMHTNTLINQQIDNINNLPHDLYEVVSESLTNKRKNKILKVCYKRTDQIRLVLDNVHDPHNISACLRSADAFGILNVDIINIKKNSNICSEKAKKIDITKDTHNLNNSKKFKASSAACGISNWLNINNFDSINAYEKFLKNYNYLLFAGITCDKYANNYHTNNHIKNNQNNKNNEKLLFDIRQVSEFAFNSKKKIALIFGNEHSGINKNLDRIINHYFSIAMVGFAESINVSVAAALSMNITRVNLYNLFKKNQIIEDFYLTKSQKLQLLNLWYAKKNPNWQNIYNSYRKKQTH